MPNKKPVNIQGKLTKTLYQHIMDKDQNQMSANLISETTATPKMTVWVGVQGTPRFLLPSEDHDAAFVRGAGNKTDWNIFEKKKQTGSRELYNSSN